MKHYFEPALMASYVAEVYDASMKLIMIRTGYRYQGPLSSAPGLFFSFTAHELSFFLPQFSLEQNH